MGQQGPYPQACSLGEKQLGHHPFPKVFFLLLPGPSSGSTENCNGGFSTAQLEPRGGAELRGPAAVSQLPGGWLSCDNCDLQPNLHGCFLGSMVADTGT